MRRRGASAVPRRWHFPDLAIRQVQWTTLRWIRARRVDGSYMCHRSARVKKNGPEPSGSMNSPEIVSPLSSPSKTVRQSLNSKCTFESSKLTFDSANPSLPIWGKSRVPLRPSSPVSKSILVIRSPLRYTVAPSQWPSIDTHVCEITAGVGATGVAVGVGVGVGVGVAVGVGGLVGVGL